MIKINELAERLCPEGIEYKPFGEIATIVRGASPRPIKKYVTDQADGVNWIKIGDVKPGSKYITDVDEKITPEGAQKSRFVKEGDFILSNSMSFGRPYIMKTSGCIHDGWLSISNFSNYFIPDFLYYLLSSNKYQGIMKQKASFGGAVQNLNADIVRELPMPIVPLEVQQEIVRILDQFTQLTTELTAELNAELTARKQQYKYYRASIFNKQKDVTWTTLGSICKKVTSGGTPKAGNSDYYGGTIPWLRTQEIDWHDIYDTSIKITDQGLQNSSAKWISPNCVIVAMYGATAAKVAINKIPLTTNQACCNLEIDETKALYRYVFHWLCKEYWSLKALGQGSQSNLNAQTIKQYKIPLPPLPEQRRIVDILDRFDALCNDLTSGLSAEIAARQKQYEYYRDKLLSFKEL